MHLFWLIYILTAFNSVNINITINEQIDLGFRLNLTSDTDIAKRIFESENIILYINNIALTYTLFQG